MQLSDSQRKFLIQDQVIGSGVVNFLINALLGWLSFRKLESVPLKGDPSVVNDVIGTMVLLPLILCLIVTPLVRKAIQAGKVEPLATSLPLRKKLLWLPSLSFLRGLVLGLISLALLGPVLLGLFWVSGVDSVGVGSFVFIKALYAGVLAALVAPVTALYVLAKAPAPDAAAAELGVHSPTA